ncbi:MAG: glyoxalase [Micrococcaceae bacterium]|nr:glyoxalase [Micrococcaceae bacterium]
MSGAIVHFEIPADDRERAANFYRSAFGWKISAMQGMDYDMLQTTETSDQGMPKEPGAINGGMLQRTERFPSPVITVDVDDIDAALAKVKEFGGSVVEAKQPIAEMGFTAYFRDSEGNLLGLWQNA